jgi:hypothetical protein
LWILVLAQLALVDHPVFRDKQMGVDFSRGPGLVSFRWIGPGGCAECLVPASRRRFVGRSTRRGSDPLRLFQLAVHAAGTCVHIPTGDKMRPALRSSAIRRPRPGDRSDPSTAKPRCSRCRASRGSNRTTSPSQYACAASARCRRGSAPATASTSSTCVYCRGRAGARYNALPQGHAGRLGSPPRPLFKLCQRVPAQCSALGVTGLSPS